MDSLTSHNKLIDNWSSLRNKVYIEIIEEDKKDNTPSKLSKSVEYQDYEIQAKKKKKKKN